MIHDWVKWSDEGRMMLSSSLDNLRLLKLLNDAGYQLPEGKFAESDEFADHAWDLFKYATEKILGAFALDESDEDGEDYGYDYQPGTIGHARLKHLYELATSDGDWERIDDAIRPFLYVTNSFYTMMTLSVNEKLDGYVVEFCQFDYHYFSDFVECFISLEDTVKCLVKEFETREKQKSAALLCLALRAVA